ncbi:MAG: hypothetical protein A2677_00385 [Candidatus Komeilibacteria bacterium RIFCSPHIGHO2_01_FULL_52_14]|uniref:Uncharacterized protein n=1 Tax=Candidatus Komeilibacteria bacterium RIFCSPHIGHO2_01_FULL_52_14 TaxID=1798549 RepID=A0A1G2BM19_9BACT|nr:MAG: hypothetical protein A2677_00385 [Candidatus Komeilibacteria bacterium RIFCSPHIGHO2_01_FULL_52_14]
MKEENRLQQGFALIGIMLAILIIGILIVTTQSGRNGNPTFSDSPSSTPTFVQAVDDARKAVNESERTDSEIKRSLDGE